MKRALTLLLVLLLALSLCSCRRAPEETGETDVELAAPGAQDDNSAPAEDNARNTEDGTESASPENDIAEPTAEKTPAPTEEKALTSTEAEPAGPEPEKPRGYVYTDTVAGFRVLPITKEIFEEASKNTKQ